VNESLIRDIVKEEILKEFLSPLVYSLMTQKTHPRDPVRAVSEEVKAINEMIEKIIYTTLEGDEDPAWNNLIQTIKETLADKLYIENIKRDSSGKKYITQIKSTDAVSNFLSEAESVQIIKDVSNKYQEVFFENFKKDLIYQATGKDVNLIIDRIKDTLEKGKNQSVAEGLLHQVSGFYYFQADANFKLVHDNNQLSDEQYQSLKMHDSISTLSTTPVVAGSVGVGTAGMQATKNIPFKEIFRYAVLHSDKAGVARETLKVGAKGSLNFLKTAVKTSVYFWIATLILSSMAVGARAYVEKKEIDSFVNEALDLLFLIIGDEIKNINTNLGKIEGSKSAIEAMQEISDVWENSINFEKIDQKVSKLITRLTTQDDSIEPVSLIKFLFFPNSTPSDSFVFDKKNVKLTSRFFTDKYLQENKKRFVLNLTLTAKAFIETYSYVLFFTVSAVKDTLAGIDMISKGLDTLEELDKRVKETSDTRSNEAREKLVQNRKNYFSVFQTKFPKYNKFKMPEADFPIEIKRFSINPYKDDVEGFEKTVDYYNSNFDVFDTFQETTTRQDLSGASQIWDKVEEETVEITDWTSEYIYDDKFKQLIDAIGLAPLTAEYKGDNYFMPMKEE